MKGTFTAPAGALASSVKFAAKWIATKPTIPAHGGILFDVQDGKLSVSGFNENVTARATLEVDGDAAGKFVVAGRLIDALVATFPDKPITFEQDGASVAVSAGRFRATLPSMSENDYPSLPGQATLAGTVDGASLADAVHRVGAAASRDISNRIHLAGIHVSFDSELDADEFHTLTFTATDSYRAARQSVEWDPHDNGATLGSAALILAATLVDAAEAFVGPDPVQIGWDEAGKGSGVFSLTTPARSLVVRTLGDVVGFPDVRPMFEYKTSARADITTKDMSLPLKRADLLRNRDSDAVTLTFAADMVTLASSSDGSGDGDEEIDIKYDGDECSMIVKSTLLGAALSTAPGSEASLAFVPGSRKPIVITAPADPTWRHLIMPLTKLGGQK